MMILSDLKYILLIGLCALMACESAVEQTVYLAHTLPISHPVHQGIEVFADEVDRLSAGEMSIKIFPDAQLGSEREVLELLQIGSISMTKVSAATMSNFAPEYKVLGIPYLFRDKQHFFNVLEGPVGQELLDKGQDYLLKGMAFYDAGSRSFYTKERPINTPADLDGLKIRVMNDQMSVDMVNTLGGSATPMSYGELYTALQQGVVDGAENNPPSFVTSRHYEVCKYYSLDEHSSLPDVLVISTKYWNTLNPQQKEWMTEAAANSVVAQKKFWKDNVAECMEILKDANVEIIRPDKSTFANKVNPILTEFINQPGMKSLIENIQNQ